MANVFGKKNYSFMVLLQLCSKFLVDIPQTAFYSWKGHFAPNFKKNHSSKFRSKFARKKWLVFPKLLLYDQNNTSVELFPGKTSASKFWSTFAPTILIGVLKTVYTVFELMGITLRTNFFLRRYTASAFCSNFAQNVFIIVLPNV